MSIFVPPTQTFILAVHEYWAMFVRADRLLSEEPDWFSKHVLGFHWEGFIPHLEYFDLEDRELKELDLQHLELIVSDTCRCVGSFSDDGYVPCPKHVKLTGGFAQCPTCAEVWIPVQECIFEPRCNGELCQDKDARFCRKAHVVYAAFHGDLVKVGMTGGTRLRERAIEQGADAIVPLVQVQGRKNARSLEKEITRRLRAKQGITGQDFSKALLVRQSKGRLEDRYRTLLRSLEGEYPVMNADLQLLSDYPMRVTLDEPPVRVDTVGPHQGKVLGIKGRFLIYEDDRGEVKMLELADLPSRLVETGQKG